MSALVVTPTPCPLDGVTNNTAGTWVADQLSGLGLDPSGLIDALPYQLPTHAVLDGGRYQSETPGLAELSRWFDVADEVLGAVAEKYTELKPGPSPVRCWPHHFDIATLIELDTDGGENARSVGVGMTPGDDSRPQPYFYVAPWPYPDVAKLGSLKPPAFWNTEGWVGAVIEGKDVVKLPSADDQMDLAASATANAVEACLAILTR